MLWLLVVQQMNIMVHDYQVIIMIITHVHNMQEVKHAINRVIIIVVSTKMPHLEHLSDS